MKKTITLILAVLLIVGCSVGGTLAWLTATTGPVTNTFTYGDIELDLWEHVYNPATNKLEEIKTIENREYKIVPGVDLPKDPTVEVKANSEKCYVFVEVVGDSLTLADKITYSIDDEVWTKLDSVDERTVYYTVVEQKNETQYFNIIKDKTIYVNGEKLLKSDVENMTPGKLVFAAYACQFAKSGTANFTPEEAWASVQP